MARLAPALLALVLVSAGLAGCLTGDETSPGADPSPQGALNGSATSNTSGTGAADERSSETDEDENTTRERSTGNRSSQPENRTASDDATANQTGPWTGDPRVTGITPLSTAPSLLTTQLEVLLVPPAHGDLGSPQNESRRALDYLNATIDGIHDWEQAIDRFVQRYPRFSYLAAIDLQIHVFDRETPAVAGYDVIVAYVETAGPVFRGAASQGTPTIQQALDQLGLLDTVHASTRVILLSLFSSAPRANQTVPDYPETREVHDVTMHEFGHTFGLGHTETWTARWGPDLMNSPYPFVYGDGDPLGDGGERSPPGCISTLNLYGLAQVYGWLPNGTYAGEFGNVTLPDTLPYEEWCSPGTTGIGLPVPELRQAIEATRTLTAQPAAPGNPVGG